MRPYLISLGVGIIVGLFYALLGVRSPAPPLVALLGLLGFLIGENGYPVLKAKLTPNPSNHLSPKMSREKDKKEASS
ncbi:MAG: DUF1427 family protein [Oligoflexia bacterium]|nr:DUF1427 family protein [Oligoflexia bacterium]